MSPSPDSLEGILAGVKGYLRLRAGAMVGVGAALVLGVILVLAWILGGASGWTPGTPVPALLAALGSGAVIGLAVWVGLLLRSWFREANLTGEVERSVRLPDGSVQAQVELSRSLPPGASDALARAGEGALLRKLDQPPRELAGDPGREAGRFLRLGGGVLGTVVLLVAVLVASTPDRAWSAWAGLTRPVALLKPDPLPEIRLMPGDAELPWGETPVLSVFAEGRDSVTVHWRAVGDVPEERSVSIEGGVGEAVLPPLEAEVTYWATGRDGRSSLRHRLVPLDPFLLTELLIEATFPEHTGLPPETFQGPPTALEVPAGTRLGFSGAVDGVGETVLLRESGGGELARFSVEERGFAGGWSPPGSMRVEWGVEGADRGSALPSPFELELRADQPPEVRLSIPGDRSELPLSRRLPLRIEAADDYGLAWIELEVLGRSAAAGIDEPTVDRMSTEDQARVVLEPTLNLSDWDLGPGDDILLLARAGDNAPETQVTETPILRIVMPGRRAVREAARERIQEVPSEAAGLADRASREASRLRGLEREWEARSRAGERGQDGLREAEELRSAVEQQAELAQDVEELQERLQELREALAGGDQEDAGLEERLRQLEELLDEALTPEARERLEELLERLQEGGELQESPGELLGELADQQEALRDRLEESLQRMRRSALEDLFQGVEQEARSLAESQEELAERFRESGLSETPGDPQETDGELAAERELQRELMERNRALADRLEELAERLREDGDSEAGDRASEAAEAVSQAGESMERAGDAGEAGDAAEAGSQGDQAADDLHDAAQTLEEAHVEWQERWTEDLRTALRQGAHDALSLARRQGEVRGEVRGANALQQRELQGEEVAIRDGLMNLGTELMLATLEMPEIGRGLSEAVGEAVAAVDRMVATLTGREEAGMAPDAAAEEAQAAMNRVALLALAALDATGQSEDGSSLEELLEEMEMLAEQQEMLNEDTSSLSEEMDSEGASAQLQETAAAQQWIAEALRELGERPGASDHMDDLEELAQEGGEISRELEEGRLDGTTLARQESLLVRLLAHGRTLGMEQPTEERVGTPAGEVERPLVAPLPEEVLRGQRFTLPSAEELEALTPGQRRMVLEYVDRMNRRQSGGGGG